MRRRHIVSLSLVTLLAALLLLIVAALHSQAVLRWTFDRISDRLEGNLQAEAVYGNLMGPIRIEGLRYQDERLELGLDTFNADWNPASLMTGRVHITRLLLEDLHIAINEAVDSPERIDIEPPTILLLPLEIEHAQLDGLTIVQPRQEVPFNLDHVSLSAGLDRHAFNLHSLVITHPEYSLDARGRIELREELPVEMQLSWAAHPPEFEPIKGSAQIHGTLADLEVDTRLQQPQGVYFQGRLMDFLTDFHWQGTIRLDALNLVAIKPSLPSLEVSGQGVLSGTLSTIALEGRFQSDLPRVGEVLADLELLWLDDRLSVHHAEFVQTSNQARLQLEGGLGIKDQTLFFDASTHWQGFEWKLGPTDRLYSDSGAAQISGTLDEYRFELTDGHMRYHLFEAHQIRATGEGNLQGMNISELTSDVLRGQVNAKGRLDWVDGLSWNAKLQGMGLDVSAVVSDLPSTLALDMRSSGYRRDGLTHVGVEVRSVTGTLRDQKIKALASGSWSPGDYRIEGLDARLGDAHIQMDGQLDTHWNLDLIVKDANIAHFYPRASGMLDGKAHLTGPRERPVIQTTFQAADLRLGQEEGGPALRRLEGDVDLDLQGKKHSKIKMSAEGLQLDGQSFEKLSLNAEGTAVGHQGRIRASDEDQALDITLQGGIEQQQWRGSIDKADIKSELAGDWRLKAAAPMRASLDELMLQAACWHQDEAAFCMDAHLTRQRDWRLDLTLDDAPLALFQPWLQPEILLEGRLSGTAELQARDDKIHDAKLDLELGPGTIQYRTKAQQYPVLEYRAGRIKAVHSCTTLDVLVDFKLLDEESATGEFVLPPLGCEWATALSQTIEGRVDINTRQLGILHLLYPQVGEVSGELVAHMKLSGTVDNPQVYGYAKLHEGSVDIPPLGITLDKIRLELTKADARHLTFDGEIHSGEDILRLDGGLAIEPAKGWPFELAIRGENVQLVDLEEAKVWVSPDIRIKGEGRRIDIDGEVHIPKVEMQAFIPPQSVTISNDVVFVDEPSEEEQRRRDSRWRIYSRVLLSLGDDVTFDGFGLRGKLAGDVIVSDQPGKGTTGQGALHITEGKFRAFGVGLDIDIGRIIFAGGPVGDPGINARASRSYDDITVGVNVQGRLKSPEISVFSVPYMPESEALSYLLFGRVIQGFSFGLNEPTAGEPGSSGLDLGNLLSPGYYIDNIVGAFNTGSVMRIRYRVTDLIEIRAESASTYQAGDIIFNFER